MRLVYGLTRKIKLSIFFTKYYLRKGWGIFRIVAGPIVLLLGLVLLNVRAGFPASFGAFVIGYSVYYMLRPFLFILFRLKEFTDEQVAMSITEEGVLIEQKEADTLLKYPSIKTVLLKKKYIHILVDVKRDVEFYIPLATIIEGNAESFVKELSDNLGKSTPDA